MIGFGELRRMSLKWQTDVATVERAYALDWLLAGIFTQTALFEEVVLRDGTALGKAFLPDYPPPLEADLILTGKPLIELKPDLVAAAQAAGAQSGLQFRLAALTSSQARFEFTGPLGRRSAAQPHLPLRFYSLAPHLPTVTRPILHPFSDPIRAMARAISLTELAAERLAMLGGRPRARDVYDLWFILTHASDDLDRKAAWQLAEQLSRTTEAVLKPELDPTYRPLLEKAWEGALKRIPNHPNLEQALEDLGRFIRPFHE